MKKWIAVFLTYVCFLGSFSFSLVSAGDASRKDRPYCELIKTYDIEQDLTYILTENHKLLVRVRLLAEKLGADIEWNLEQRMLTFSFDGQLLGKAIDKTTISFSVPSEDADDRISMVYIKQGELSPSLLYYVVRYKDMNGQFYAPIQCILEPFFEVVLDMDAMQVHLYDNPAFQRTKIIPSQAQIISNYKAFEFNLWKENDDTPLYVGLNDFFQSISTNAVFKLQPPRLIYASPHLGYALMFHVEEKSLYLVHEQEEAQETLLIELEHELRMDDQQPYLALPDLKAILDAQTHCFKDREQAIYLTFDW